MRQIERKGQSVAEYAIVFSVVAAAIIGMQIFVKRGLQAKEKSATNYFTNIGGGVTGVTSARTIGSTAQYEPYYAKSDYTVEQDRSSIVDVREGYKVDTTGVKEKTTRTAGGKTEQGVDQTKDNLW